MDAVMTPEEFAEKIRACDSWDTESAHFEADKIMCDLLRQLGYQEGVETFEKMHKWYA